MVAHKTVRLLSSAPRERTFSNVNVTVYETVKKESDGLVPVVTSTRKDGRSRATRPVLVDNELFLSCVEAGEFIKKKTAPGSPSSSFYTLVSTLLSKVAFGEPALYAKYIIRFATYDELIDFFTISGGLSNLAEVTPIRKAVEPPAVEPPAAGLTPDGVRAMVTALDEYERFASALSFVPSAGKFEVSAFEKGIGDVAVTLTAEDAGAVRDLLLERGRAVLLSYGVKV